MLFALASGWWLLVLRGISGVLLGLAVCTEPGITLSALALMYSAYALIDGGLTILCATAVFNADGRWGLLFADGVVGVAAGLAAFPWPGMTASDLIWVIASRALASGLVQGVTAVRLRNVSTSTWPPALWAIASTLFGVALIIAPVTDALALTLCLGSYALVAGLLLIVFAHLLRAWLKSNNLGDWVPMRLSGSPHRLPAGLSHGDPEN